MNCRPDEVLAQGKKELRSNHPRIRVRLKQIIFTVFSIKCAASRISPGLINIMHGETRKMKCGNSC